MNNITFYNAGAGSGKTHTLTTILAELIGKKEVRPDEIILTTFTKKAATDFKKRSKEMLFKNGLTEEANLLDGALIGTIHSVAFSIVSKFWYYLGLSPKLQIISEEEEKIYRSQSLGSLPTPEELDVIHEFVDKYGITNFGSPDYNLWRGHLEDILAFSTNYEIDDYAESCRRSKQVFEGFIDPDAPDFPISVEIEKALDQLYEIILPSKTTDSTRQQLKEDISDLKQQCSQPSIPLYYKVLKLILSVKKADREKVDMDPVVSPVKAKLIHMWMRKDVNSYASDYIDVLFHIAERWHKVYAEFKEKRHILDYNDLEKYLLKLIKDPVASKEIGAKYRYVFVDEFQDCSPIQIKIFDALSDLAEHSYWVGDLKQSIYGFRGSDTAMVDAVIKALKNNKDKGCHIKSLSTSYRSVPGIVRFCNELFSQAFSDMNKDDVVLKSNNEVDASIKPLVLWNCKDKDKKDNKDRDMEEIAGMVANLMASLRAGKEKASDIAILSRTNGELKRIAEFLTKRNIPVNLSSVPLKDSKATTLAKAILRVADNKADALAKAEVAFLLDPRYDTESLISKALEQFGSKTHEESDAKPEYHAFLDEIPVLRRLSEIRARLSQQSLAEFVESVILELNLFEEVMKCCDPQEGTAVLNTVIEAAKTFEDACISLAITPSVKGFIDYLDRKDPKDADKYKVTLPGDPDGVVLSTIHGAKGLAWKYVIVTSMSYNPAKEMDIMKHDVFGVHFRREEAPSERNVFPKVYISLMPFIYGAKNSNVPETIAQIICNWPEFDQIRKNSIEEAKRLLYVAMTRPSHQLALVYLVPKEQKTKPEPKRPRKKKDTQDKKKEEKLSLQWLKDIGVGSYTDPEKLYESGFVPEVLEAEAQIPANVVCRQTYKVELPEKPYERRDHSPSMLQGKLPVKSHKDFGRRIPLGKLQKDVEMDTVGNCIHHIYRLSGHEFADSEAVTRILDSYGLTTTLCDVKEIEAAWSRLLEFLKERHGEVLSLEHERPFIMHSEGKVYSGSIDLTATVADGVVLIDYKTCPLGNDRILDEGNAHFAGLYGGQLGCYRKALQTSGHDVVATYVYYPVSGLIVEL